MEGGEGVRVKALDFHLRDRRVNLATREMARGLATEFRGWQLLAVPIPDGEGGTNHADIAFVARSDVQGKGYPVERLGSFG